MPILIFSPVENIGQQSLLYIPNGCFDAYEVKVNKDICKYQEKVKLVSRFQIYFLFFNGLLEFTSFP